MKLTLKKTPEQIELIKAMGSRNIVEAAQAQEAFAAFIAPVIQQIIQQASVRSMIFSDLEFNQDDGASIPLDLFYNEDVNYVQVWSQSIAGGLASSAVEGVKEMKLSTYTLDSAVHFLKSYARKSRLDVVSRAVQKMAQELTVREERNAFSVLLRALGEASTRGTKHTIAVNTAGVLLPNDFSRLITLGRRLSASFANGTPDPNAGGFGVTDAFVSPEVKEKIRGWAFNPINSVGNQSTGPVALPNEVRLDIYRSAGTSEIYGINITDILELGTTGKYTSLFGNFATASIAPGNANWANGTNDLIIGVDMSRQGLFRAIAVDADNSQITAEVDNQWTNRSDKAGFYSHLEEGFVCTDSRVLAGIIL